MAMVAVVGAMCIEFAETSGGAAEGGAGWSVGRRTPGCGLGVSGLRRGEVGRWRAGRADRRTAARAMSSGYLALREVRSGGGGRSGADRQTGTRATGSGFGYPADRAQQQGRCRGGGPQGRQAQARRAGWPARRGLELDRRLVPGLGVAEAAGADARRWEWWKALGWWPALVSGGGASCPGCLCGGWCGCRVACGPSRIPRGGASRRGPR